MANWTIRNAPHWDEVICPECENEMELQEDDIQDGELVICSRCGSEFEVVTRPFELRRIEDATFVQHRQAS
jgi:alpha-aminoadipate/glutamate carrier protein LysW